MSNESPERKRRPLAELAIALVSSINEREVLDLILTEAMEISGSDAACIAFYSEEEKTFNRTQAKGLSDHFVRNMKFRTGGLAELAFNSNQAVPCYNGDPRHRLSNLCELERIQGFLCLPMKYQDKRLGVLYVYSKHRTTFTSEEERDLQTYASLATLATHNAMNHAMEVEKSKRLGIFYRVASAISESVSMPAFLEEILRSARELAGSDHAAVAIINTQTRVIEHFDSILGEGKRNGMPSREDLRQLLLFCIAEREELWIKNITGDPRLKSIVSQPTTLSQAICMPIPQDNGLYGALLVANPEGGKYEKSRIDAVRSLAVQTGNGVTKIRLREETERHATMDGLTGLANHREFQRLLESELERAKRYNRELSLLMVDIDHFKHFNDAHGHPTGDLILKELAGFLRSQLRTVDLPCRYGGEEFTIVLPETGGEGAELVAQRLGRAIYEHAFVSRQGDRVLISASIGVASFPIDAETRETMIETADQALYFAKENGRNRVARYTHTLKSEIEQNQVRLVEILMDPKLKTLNDLASAVDAKSAYSRGHSADVASFASAVGEFLGVSDEDKQTLHIAGLLHDIGTISIPERILNKPGPLTPEERRVVQSHPRLAETFIKNAEHLQSTIPAVLHHHERWDGTGYPDGLRGEQIPYLARIIGIAEAYDAMIHPRPYRRRRTKEEAFRELRENAGSQFDPDLVETFIRSQS